MSSDSEPSAGGSMPAPRDAALAPVIEQLIEATQLAVFARILGQVGNAADAFDRLQDTLVKVWEKAESYDPSRPGEPWIKAIADNVVIDHRRAAGAQKRGRPLSLDQHLAKLKADGDQRGTGEPVDTRTADPAERILRLDSVEEMDRAAQELNSKDQELYRLRRKGMSTKEIAAQTGQTKEAIGPALTRLMAKLKTKLSKDANETCPLRTSKL